MGGEQGEGEVEKHALRICMDYGFLSKKDRSAETDPMVVMVRGSKLSRKEQVGCSDHELQLEAVSFGGPRLADNSRSLPAYPY